MDETLLRFFIALTAFAVVIQAGILFALFLAVRKGAARMDALATQVADKTLPTLEKAQSMLVELRPKIETLASNAADSTTILRVQLGRLDATLSDVLDRTRLQVIRADEFLNRTMDKVEDTTEVVHKTVLSPIRQVSGLMSAIGTGFEVFFGQKKRQPRNGMGVPQDEMFI
jgi:hypothetical protein